ncbi:MAG: hypothetical protein ABR908_11145 [Terriglobales bacterium]|jgi:hypothetical protein
MPPKSSAKTADKANWASIISQADTPTKLLALFALVADASFLASLAVLPKEQVLKALIVCATFLLLSIVGILLVEFFKNKSAGALQPQLSPSPLTPDSPPLSELVNTAIQAVCRAVSLPQSPDIARLRVFIFRKMSNQLVCSHYWAQNPVQEMVGRLRFEINSEMAEKVAVVRAVVDGKICRTKVEPLPKDMSGYNGKVSDEVRFVLATPIYTKEGDIWGTVDFDAGNEIGVALLSNEVCDATMFQLAQHLQIILSVPTWGRAVVVPNLASS